MRYIYFVNKKATELSNMTEKKDKTEQNGAQAEEETVDCDVKTAEKDAEKEAVKEELVKKSELDQAVASAEDFKRRLYSVTAEYENYRKRMANTASQKYTEGRCDIIEKFFVIGDNVERALAIASDEKMKKGLEMILKAYDKIMSEEGIEVFDPKGEEFDASTSTAITALPAESESEKPGTVKMTFAKGYKKGEKILRFAQVAVVKED